MTDTLLERGMDGEPGLAGLRTSLSEVLGDACRVLAVRKLTSRVYRISLTTGGPSLSLVAKRLAQPVAQRIELALERWLPAVGLAHVAPALLGASVDPVAGKIWHLYEDLGERTLEDAVPTAAAFERAVQLVATIHARFTQDSTLAEWRARGEDHGVAFYESSVRGALAAVEAAVAQRDCTVDAAGSERLCARLEGLLEQLGEMTKALVQLGGPFTLLHGDLFLKNIAQRDTGQGPNIRLLDWDRVGPGSFSYDLSTLVIRAPAPHRARVVPLYRQAAAEHGLQLPADSDLRRLFAHAECARLASMSIWIAREAAERRTPWAFEWLAEIDGWLQRAQAQCAA
jgi:hypothetical protein